MGIDRGTSPRASPRELLPWGPGLRQGRWGITSRAIVKIRVSNGHLDLLVEVAVGAMVHVHLDHLAPVLVGPIEIPVSGLLGANGPQLEVAKGNALEGLFPVTSGQVVVGVVLACDILSEEVPAIAGGAVFYPLQCD